MTARTHVLALEKRLNRAVAILSPSAPAPLPPLFAEHDHRWQDSVALYLSARWRMTPESVRHETFRLPLAAGTLFFTDVYAAMLADVANWWRRTENEKVDLVRDAACDHQFREYGAAIIALRQCGGRGTPSECARHMPGAAHGVWTAHLLAGCADPDNWSGKPFVARTSSSVGGEPVFALTADGEALFTDEGAAPRPRPCGWMAT